ncbi:SDR family NAD(P)-dependent oxidoreductase [Alkaliphilus peptidifermentans]|uniref:NAD(P)-dependent dehydrogenase, short-chain alcohol dehydrogenase family n=1 Tax=Alkaliphilus peptidifermentans DSM 18978 TaxID=1120976 RepID=A0A1G5K5N1_9FIRM|nr:SDR family NAD(P)-dependent oxidoreductase [Alkaliphilus peptidifermentans]SCY95953.1 NAD(P)-dependent dehydrogenase, short-chain alcohol dehydrogenase family [Alkaliphilus peptidifermentans DSM 18978]
MSKISFNNKVAVITGAAQGLGREYAKLLASLGAITIINDIATDEDGNPLANKVVNEIIKGGGHAIANTNNIACKEGITGLIKAVEESYGAIDILIHNAGVFVDKPFLQFEDRDWYDVINIHLNGSYHLLKAIIPLMRQRNYGRIIMITSSVGMYGMANHASYGAAKMGVYGLVQSLKLELEDTEIKCNLVSPLAATGQTSYALNKELHKQLDVEMVAPLVAYLASEECTHNGSTFVAGGGYFSSVGIFEGGGVYIPKEKLSIESIFGNISQITDLSMGVHISSTGQSAKKIFRKIFSGRRANKQ